ncbi:TPA: hypothetical protein ACH3X1_009696 [Trebouxia sp. C0004]
MALEFLCILSGKSGKACIVLSLDLCNENAGLWCRSPLFKKMCEVISSSNVPYEGPAYNAMRTDLLMAKFKQPEKFAKWVDEIDEEQQEALLGLEGAIPTGD